MKKYFDNIHCAPRSTILGVVLFCLLTWLHGIKVLDREAYGMVAVPLLGFCFTDLMGEKGKRRARKLTDPDKPSQEPE